MALRKRRRGKGVNTSLAKEASEDDDNIPLTGKKGTDDRTEDWDGEDNKQPDLTREAVNSPCKICLTDGGREGDGK